MYSLLLAEGYPAVIRCWGPRPGPGVHWHCSGSLSRQFFPLEYSVFKSLAFVCVLVLAKGKPETIATGNFKLKNST